MAILGRGLENLPLSTDSLIIGVGGLVEELPVGTLNQVFTVTASGVDWADLPPLGATEFTGLNDTPADYTGSGGLVVKVNVGETALEFGQIDGSEINNDLGWITQVEDDPSPKLAADLDADSFTVINLPNPINSGDAVSKNYADDTFVEIAGDTMTGFLTLNADPVLALHAATKQYVDGIIGASELNDLTDTTIAAPANGQVLTYNSGTSQWENQASGTGVTEFISLNDTPANYTGSGGLYVRVNSTPDALEFVQIAASELNNDEGWITSTLTQDLDADTTFKIINLAAPTSALDAVNKDYVDNLVVGNYVQITGDTMTGLLTLSGDPTSALEAATKQYVDNEITAAIQGLDIKDSVHVATTTSLSASYADNDVSQGGQGDTLTATSVGTFALDGITATGNADPAADMVVGDRVLVKDQVNAKTNGIYTITDMGSGSTLWELTRAADADNSPNGELTQGTFTYVEFGTTNGGSSWVATSSATGGVDPDNYYQIDSLTGDDIEFSIFTTSGTISAGDGLQKVGNVVSAVGTTSRIAVSGSGIDIDAAYAGQTSIDTVGTVTTGTWEGDPVDNQRGAFGTSIAAIGAKSLISRDASEITVGSANQVLTSNGTVYAAAYVNALRDTDGSATAIIGDNDAADDRIVIADYTTLAAADPDGAFTPKGYVDAQISSISSQDTWKTIIINDGFITPPGPDTTLSIFGEDGLQTRSSGTTISVDFDISNLTTVTPANGDLLIIADDSDSGFTKAIDVQDLLERAFTDLTDTPLDYSGAIGYYVRVNGAGNGLEFTDAVLESGDNVSELANDAGYLVNIVEDLTPELGGNLDVLNSDIVSSSNRDIRLLPNGTGNVVLDQLNWPTGVGTSGQVLTTDGAGQLSFTTVSGGTQDLWETISSDAGSTTADSPTDDLMIAGGTNISTSIAGDTLTIDFTGTTYPDQNIWETVAGDSGSTTASSTTQTLTIAGGTDISTVMSGNTLTITNDAPVTTQISNITAEPIGDLVDVVITSPSVSDILQYNGSQWVNATPSAVGETNTASNVGTDGVGVFDGKSGVDLQFRNVAPASTKVTTVLNGQDIDIDVVPGNILTSTLNNDANFLTTVEAGGTDTQIQYNNNDALAGDTGFTTDGAGGLTVTGYLNVDNVNIDGDDITGSGTDLTLTTTTTDADIVLDPNGDGMVDIGGIFHTKRQTATLPDNTSVAATLFTFSAASYESVIVEYGIKRGAVGAKTGTLMIINDGTNVQISDTGVEIGDAGVTFSATLPSTDVFVKYTTTDDAGDQDATIAYSMRMWNVI